MTLPDLVSQIACIGIMVVLAYATASVWAVVMGAVAAAGIKLVLTWRLLPGPSNRVRWDKTAAHSLIHFGKWMFLSTACDFLLSQGDKAIFGAHLSVDALGFYNIG